MDNRIVAWWNYIGMQYETIRVAHVMHSVTDAYNYIRMSYNIYAQNDKDKCFCMSITLFSYGVQIRSYGIQYVLYGMIMHSYGIQKNSGV